MDLIYLLLFLMIIIGIIFFIYQSMNRNEEDYEHDGSSSTRIRHGNL